MRLLSLRIKVWLRALAVAGMATFLAAATPAHAQGVGIIRDAEIEDLIIRFATPLFKAAKVRSTPKVNLVSDRRFNAFVVEDGTLFVNYGTILESQTPGALKAVLAHEIGHLAGGHLARIRERAEINGTMQAVALVLGAGAIVASSASGGGGEIGEMASAFILASQSAGQNDLLAFRRSEESTADAAGLKYLESAGQSPKGMVDVLTHLTQDQVARTGASSYLSTHPDADERLNHVTNAAKSSKFWSKRDSAADIRALALAQAKLSGFLESQQTVLNRYPNSDKSQAARYARIITAYKSGAAVSALTQMPQLASASPSNPYFQELLGQMYFETGKAKSAIAPLKKAISLAPDATQIRILYGQALTDTGNYAEAVLQLNRASREEPDNPRPFLLLSRAYAGMGKQGEASLAAAEAAMARGEKGTALGLARQAQRQLDKTSPAWLRAEDIILNLG